MAFNVERCESKKGKGTLNERCVAVFRIIDFANFVTRVIRGVQVVIVIIIGHDNMLVFTDTYSQSLLCVYSLSLSICSIRRMKFKQCNGWEEYLKSVGKRLNDRVASWKCDYSYKRFNEMIL